MSERFDDIEKRRPNWGKQQWLKFAKLQAADLKDATNTIERLKARCETNRKIITSQRIAYGQLESENERLRAALDNPVTLKDYRDLHRKTPDHMEMKPLAWPRTRKALQDQDNE